MGATRKKMTFKGPSNGSLIELMPKTTGDQVYLNDETPLTPKIAEMVSAINLREKITDHLSDVGVLNETIDTKVADAIHNADTKNSELKAYVDDNITALNESMTASHTTINNSIEAANADIALRAKKADVDAALDLKANAADVESSISSLSISVDKKLDLKADKTAVNTSISELSNAVDGKLDLKANTADMNAALDLKANTTDVDTKLTNLKQEILGDMPVEAYDTFTELAAFVAEHEELADSLTEAIGTKANKTDVDAALDLKANKTDVNTAISDLSSSVDEKLAVKTNKTDVNDALDLKANKTDVDAALDLKANKTDVDAALSGKVNTTDLVDPGNATISLIQGGMVKGSFSVNQSNNVEIILDNNNPIYTTMVAASSTEDGKGGLVPAPTAGKHRSYLRGDGTWSDPTDTKPTLEALGISATAAEINQIGGVTGNVQVQLDNKTSMEDVEAAIADAITEVDTKLETTNDSLNSLSDTVDATKTDVSNLSTSTAANFNTLTDSLNTEFNAIDDRINDLSTLTSNKFTNVDNRFSEMQTSIDDVDILAKANRQSIDNLSTSKADASSIPPAVAVKGNAESTYRTGNVNITPANIGLGAVNNTADANKSVKYATSAGNADTLDGYHITNIANQLFAINTAYFSGSIGSVTNVTVEGTIPKIANFTPYGVLRLYSGNALAIPFYWDVSAEGTLTVALANHTSYSGDFRGWAIVLHLRTS